MWLSMHPSNQVRLSCAIVSLNDNKPMLIVFIFDILLVNGLFRHVEPANINDITPVPTVLKEIEQRLGHLPKYMGFDAGYHSAGIAHLLESKDIQAVIGYRRHTHATETFGKYRFKYDWEHDCYICP